MYHLSIRYVIFILIIVGVISLSSHDRTFASDIPLPTDYASILDAFLLTQMKDYKIPGLAVAIVRNGEVEYLKGYGVANPNGDPVTPDTPFLLASVSKSFTALAIMQLVEERKINLNDPVRKYLPWFDVKGSGESEITVAHLVYQTSGFSEYDGAQMNLRPNNPNELETAIRGLDEISLLFQPGESWEYSNINYSLLGFLIQEVSGQTYESYIEENIFIVLEMSNSHTSLEGARANNAARGYTFYFGAPLALEANIPYSPAILPTAGLWASASDMSRYLIAHLDEEAEILVSAEGMKKIHTPGVEIEPGYHYAMGWFHAPNILDPEFLQTLDTDLDQTDDLQVLWHEGDGPGYKTVVVMLPGEEYGVALMMNTIDHTITSVYKNFAWDVTLIANGGNAYYFQPEEKFLIRNSRWIAIGLILFLLGGLIWTIRKYRQVGNTGWDLMKWLVILLNMGLLVYIYFGFLPDNNVSLPVVLRYSPDIGILIILITIFSFAWIVMGAWMLMKTRAE